MDSRTAVGLASVLIVVATSGCSGEGAAPAAPTETVTETVTVSPTPEASDSPAEPPGLGIKQKIDFGTVTALEYKATVTTDLDGMRAVGDERWAGVLAEACVSMNWKGEPIKLSWMPWSITDADGGNYAQVGMTGLTYPLPTYPLLGDRTTRPGTCAKGWIVFDVARGAKLKEVIYEGSSAEAPYVWKLK